MKKIMMLFSIVLLFISFGCNLNNKNEKNNKDFGEKKSIFQKQNEEDNINNSNLENKGEIIEDTNETDYSLEIEYEIIKRNIFDMSLKELTDFSTQYKNCIFKNYYFINYTEDINIVVKTSDDYKKIETVNIYNNPIINKDVISNIKIGMTLEEVVKMIGNPIGSYTFGIASLDFSIGRDCTMRIQITDDLKVVCVNII